ncbi:GNAT family N-acetyltransferase [Reinekea sp. G2M2-21]|uniref:GNAT family N-acetyltransferase n=1 Tax=Reinekea sp. G2M2-21 TaxID=2788942 RepID=UPI0018AA3AFD
MQKGQKVNAQLILFPIEHEDYEIGYVLNPSFWGLGLATGIVTALTDFAFSLRALCVKACVRETNLISKRIILKLAYVEVGNEFGEDGVNRLYFKKDKATS